MLQRGRPVVFRPVVTHLVTQPPFGRVGVPPAFRVVAVVLIAVLGIRLPLCLAKYALRTSMKRRDTLAWVLAGVTFRLLSSRLCHRMTCTCER